MPPIDGLFHKKLHLIRDDGDDVIGIAVSGPITHWDPDATAARIEATIEQDGQVVAEGHTAEDVSRPGTFWMLVAPIKDGVPPPHPGPANGKAKATVHTGAGDVPWPWPASFELV